MDHERAERHLRLLAESALRGARGKPGGWVGLDRVRDVANVLAAVGAVEEEVADTIVGQLPQSMAARSLAPMNGRIPILTAGTGRLPASPAAAAPGPLRAVPAGRLVRLPGDETPCELYLMSAVVMPGVTTIAATLRVRLPDSASSFHRPYVIGDRITATDDRGAPYDVDFSGASAGGGEWEGFLNFRPEPPVTVKWLDLVADGAVTVARIDLTAGAVPVEIAVEAHPAAPGEHLLTETAEHLLAEAVQSPVRPSQAVKNLGAVVTALDAAGALPADSPVPGRLAALCQRLGWDDHGITGAAARDLPGPWHDLLTSYREKNWAEAGTGAAAVAVTLPEIDGVRFAVAGAHAGSDESLLRVFASGLAPASHDLPVVTNAIHIGFSWWARDGIGRWHLAIPDNCEVSTDGEARFSLTFLPPLGPETDDVELVVTGPSARIRARVPLVWCALEW